MFQNLFQGKSSGNKNNIYEKNVYPLIKKQKLPVYCQAIIFLGS